MPLYSVSMCKNGTQSSTLLTFDINYKLKINNPSAIFARGLINYLTMRKGLKILFKKL